MAKYDWRDGPATLSPHSLAKHTILRKYVEEYVCILTRNGTLPNLSVVLIDGFAGGGEYIVEGRGDKIHDGSPFILMGAVDAALARLNHPDRHRKKPVEVDARFVFIEREKANWAYLKNALGKRAMLDEKVRLVHGAFEDSLDGIIAEIQDKPGRKHRPIFVLDQYGYAAIPVGMIAKIMRELPTAEIFLTLAVENISAHASTAEQALARLRESLHVDPRTDDFFAGRKDMEEADALSDEDRANLMFHIQWILHETFARHAGARCYTPFFITSRGSNRSFWFLHLANDSKANDVVKSLHWNVSTHFKHYGRDGTKMLILGFDPAREGLARQIPLGGVGSEFDDSARARTERALVEELPAIIQAKYRDGITHKSLYQDLCNETPASKEILGTAINQLCRDGELDKVGANGQRRELSTKVQDSDIIQLTRRPSLFSILRHKK